jgi:hypothetical protein
VRDASAAVVLPVPRVASAASALTTVTVPGETIGSVALAPGGTAGVLYTSATPSERITVLNLSGAAPSFRTVLLHSPVLAVFTSPDASDSIILHDTTATPNALGAFSIVPLGADLPAKIVDTKAPPTAVAMTSDHAIVAENDEGKGVFAANLVRMPELSVARIVLASPVKSVGIVPTVKNHVGRAYVAQEHPEGRITFVDLDTNMARTLTGFELASRVVDGSDQ